MPIGAGEGKPWPLVAGGMERLHWYHVILGQRDGKEGREGIPPSQASLVLGPSGHSPAHC